MKIIEVPRLIFADKIPALADVSARFDMLNERNSIGEVNWEKYRYKPVVEFSLGYTEKELIIKYYVTEECFKAEKTETNQNVFEDSCVEFFFLLPDEKAYCNLEFNGIGTCLAGMGTSRNDRVRLNEKLVEKIRRKSSAGESPVSEVRQAFSWDLVVAIPRDLLKDHSTDDLLQGRQLKANFYKCGDKLSAPHYLTWNPILTEKPDYHRPEYFGTLKFKF